MKNGKKTALLIIALALIIAAVALICTGVFKNNAVSELDETMPAPASESEPPQDTTPPVITGVQDIFTYVGDAVSYRSGVEVTDDEDSAPKLEIDSGKVNLSEPGEYEVRYTATDAAGNSATQTAIVTVGEKHESYVELDVIYAAVDAILDEIITDDMTRYEQIAAIAEWYKQNTNFWDKSDPNVDYRQAAYILIQKGNGDCFYFFGLCKLMLDRLGIPNIDVEKVPMGDWDSHHYWSLVSLDDGETWYHLDLTPHLMKKRMILVTDAVLDKYSEGNYGCFNRDKSLYPATPEEAAIEPIR